MALKTVLQPRDPIAQDGAFRSSGEVPIHRSSLAAGMAHDIHNPLAYATANLDVVIEDLRITAGGAPSGRRGAVLIVDDEPAVGIVLRRLLRSHDVTLVTTAKAALDLFISGKHFDVILSDLMMPDMNGMDLFDELTLRRPDAAQRVVFMSGGTLTAQMDAFLERVGNRILSKPFDAETVRALVQGFISP